jgi:hypothetical protein
VSDFHDHRINDYKAYLIPYSQKIIIRIVDKQNNKEYQIDCSDSPVTFYDNETVLRQQLHDKLELVLNEIFRKTRNADSSSDTLATNN